MRANSQSDRVPTELAIEGGYLSMLDQDVNEASTEAHADPTCGGHRRNWLKRGLGERNSHPLATYSESRRTVRPSTAMDKVRAVRPLIASKRSPV